MTLYGHTERITRFPNMKKMDNYRTKVCSKPLTLIIKLWRVTLPAPLVQETRTVPQLCSMRRGVPLLFQAIGLTNNKKGDKKSHGHYRNQIRIPKQPYINAVYNITDYYDPCAL